jgi:hypothetical protein
MKPKADVVQSKVLVDPLLGDCWRVRGKLTLLFFRVNSKRSFKGLFLGSLGDAPRQLQATCLREPLVKMICTC